MREIGNWSWDDPLVKGSRPYNGLLVILLAFNSWDLKQSNNCDLRRAAQWPHRTLVHGARSRRRARRRRATPHARATTSASSSNAVHRRRERRLRRVRLRRQAARSLPPADHGRRRAVGHGSAGGSRRPAVARRVSRRRLPRRTQRSLHPENQDQHPPGPASWRADQRAMAQGKR